MAEIVPVASVDGREIGSAGAGAPGPMTARLAAAYERTVRSSGTPINRTVAAMREVVPEVVR
jgi:hypothetical protein